MRSVIARLTTCILAVLMVTAVLFVLPLRDRPLTAALVLLLLVLFVASKWGFRYALVASSLAGLAFSGLLPPVGRFTIDDSRDVLALVVFLVVGTVASHLSDRARREAVKANERRAEAVAAQQRFVDLVNSLEGIVWEADANTLAFSFVSEQAERILGYPVEQWLRDPTFWKDHIHPEDREPTVQFYIRATEEKRNHEFEYRMIAADGRVVWLRDLMTIVVEHGRASRLRGVIVDITQRKYAEQTLKRTEFYLAEAQKLTHTGSWAYNPITQNYHYWSEELFRICGLDPQQGIPRDEEARGLVHADDFHKLIELETAFRNKADFATEYRMVRRDGGVTHLHTIGHPVFDSTGELVEYVGTAVDVTERKRADEERARLRQLEADLARVNRVTTLGELTASLAHEVNQPIAAAMTDANTCVRWLTRAEPDLEEAREAAKRTVKDVTRAADIISRIRALFKKSGPAHEAVDVNDLIADMVVLVNSEAARCRVSVQTDLASNLPPATGDRVELQQVVLNLMMNSIEAMRNVDRVREMTITSHCNDGGEVVVDVADTGIGLPPHRDDIFNAFFTTKPEGTGMGLAISRSILESHGGRLWAVSNGRGGATFSFMLPAVVAARN